MTDAPTRQARIRACIGSQSSVFCDDLAHVICDTFGANGAETMLHIALQKVAQIRAKKADQP